LDCLFQQRTILEAAATENDDWLPNLLGNCDDDRRECVVKLCRYPSPITLFQQSLYHWLPFNDALTCPFVTSDRCNLKRVAFVAIDAVLRIFHCHRRLALKAAPLAQTRQRGDRIKQTPHAGSQRRVDSLPKRSGQDIQFAFAEIKPVTWQILAIEFIQQAKRAAAGFTCC